MAYSESLAARVRDVVAGKHRLAEKRMFGGVGFLLRGNMCVAIWQNLLVARVGLAAYASSLSQPFVREFDVTGRPMKGWVAVEPDGVDADRDLEAWIQQAVDFVGTLPAK